METPSSETPSQQNSTPNAPDSLSPPVTDDSLEILRVERSFLEMMADMEMPIMKAPPGCTIEVIKEDGSLSPFNPEEFDYPFP